MIQLEYVRAVQEKAELRKRNALANEYSDSVRGEITEREMRNGTGLAIIALVLVALTMCFLFGGGV